MNAQADAAHQISTIGTTRGDRNKRTLYYGYCTCGAGTTTSASREGCEKKLLDHAAGNNHGIYQSDQMNARKALRELPANETLLALRWDATAILGRDARTITAAEIRQLAAQVRDACTIMLEVRAAFESDPNP